MDWKDAVRLAKDGKEEGYNYLYQQTYQKSYYAALKYMKQEDAALDVLQDAYIKAFQNLEQLQDADKFTAWFARIVATKALDELKKHKTVLFSQIDHGDEDFSTAESFQDDRIDNQPELSLDKKETSRLVQEIIDTLSDEQRICVMMYYVEEMSVKDIAEILGTSENTVKSRLNYARKNIKREVLELEKKGTKLYSLAPLPFFLYLLLSDRTNAQAGELPANHILENASKEAINRIQSTGAGTLTQAGGKIIGIATRKVIIGIAAAVVIGGGTIGGVLAYQNHQNKLAKEAIAIQQEEDRKAAEAKAEAEKEAKRLEQNKVKEEPTEQPSETPTEPAPQFTYTDLSQTKYAINTVNVRDLPSTDGNRLGGLSKAQEVAVTGQCNETGWYRIEFNGSVGYVSNEYLGDEIPAAQPAGNTNSSGNAQTPAAREPVSAQDVADNYTSLPIGQVFSGGGNYYYYYWIMTNVPGEPGIGWVHDEAHALGAASGYTAQSCSMNSEGVERYGHYDVIKVNMYIE